MPLNAALTCGKAIPQGYNIRAPPIGTNMWSTDRRHAAQHRALRAARGAKNTRYAIIQERLVCYFQIFLFYLPLQLNLLLYIGSFHNFHYGSA